MRKLKALLATMPEQVTVTRREGLMIVTICALAGMVIGMLCSPKKNVKIGSENSAYNVNSGLGKWDKAVDENGENESSSNENTKNK